MWRAVAFVALCIVCLQVIDGLSLYADASNSTLALVLCGNLKDAVAELKQRDLQEHVIGAEWLERDCVSIDPCAQTSSNENPYFGSRLPALSGVWLSGNSSALRLPSDAASVVAAEAGLKAHNYGILEFARVPEGLRLQACAPDFDALRARGVLFCDENTIVTISADDQAPSCPGASPHSLLDCMKPLQFDASRHTLVWRPPTEKMHFGERTWNEVCAPALHLPAIVRAMCSALAQFSVDIPVPASLGSTSLIKYDFLPGYGCRGGIDVDGEGEDKVLSRVAAPNRVVTCPSVAHGSPVRVDPYTCGGVCDAGFELTGSGGEAKCVSVCAGLNETCPDTYRASETCMQGSQALYRCSPCPLNPGFATRAPVEGVDDISLCHYVPCGPGTRSDGLRCHECDVNTISNASQALECVSCESPETGMYQAARGQSVCTACLWNASVTGEVLTVCRPGTSLVLDFQRVQSLFSLYESDVGADLNLYVSEMCTQGYACLPCEPGFYEHERACVPCPHASYQPNCAAEACFPCDEGQNTPSTASTRSSDCVCVGGFE
jgi:hypothetical protein